MATSKRVEFRTVDGVTLRGDLYMPNKNNKVPIVVMTQGVRPHSHHQHLRSYYSDFSNLVNVAKRTLFA